MTVFIAFAEADRGAAETLETFLERRGHFVELDNGEEALRPVEDSDVVVLLTSQNFMFGPGRMRLEQRALDAWADGNLVLAKLDQHEAPVGLRDLPIIDAIHPPHRDEAWGDVHEAIRAQRRAPVAKEAPRTAQTSAPRMRQAPQQARAKRKSGGALNVLLAALLLPGAVALATSGAIWLANRIGPRPGTMADLLRDIDKLGVRSGVPSGIMVWLFALAVAVFFVSLVLLIMRSLRPRSAPMAERAEEVAAPAAPAKAQPVFVSYARANAPLVLPVIDAAQKSGRQFWLDQSAMDAGDSWAGEIVRAIRGARGVLVMCSSAAFESDHVKREVYLADRYKKPLVPVFIEDAEPPEDFEYFFAGVQWLKLFETPEPERPAAVLRLLEAA